MCFLNSPVLMCNVSVYTCVRRLIVHHISQLSFSYKVKYSFNQTIWRSPLIVKNETFICRGPLWRLYKGGKDHISCVTCFGLWGTDLILRFFYLFLTRCRDRHQGVSMNSGDPSGLRTNHCSSHSQLKSRGDQAFPLVGPKLIKTC